jgi:hypothetical protein
VGSEFGAEQYWCWPPATSVYAALSDFADENGFETASKLVRPEFVEKVKQSEHWQHQAMVPNLLADGAEIWS